MVARAGFSLAEVVVSILLLSIVAVGVAAGGVAAAQMFTRAEVQERVLREAEAILDSLLVLPANGAGTRTLHQSRVTWNAADSTGSITVVVQMPARSVQLTGAR